MAESTTDKNLTDEEDETDLSNDHNLVSVFQNWNCIEKMFYWHSLVRCCPFFWVVIFSSYCTINLCRNKSSFTFWNFFFNKVSDKLLGQLLVLLAANLKTACTKLVFVPRSLWSNLEQNQKNFWRGYHKASFVGAVWNKYQVFEPWTPSDGSTYIENNVTLFL